MTPAREGSIPPTPSIHRLRPGLPGYLIPFAPLAFGPQRQPRSRKPPSPLVFFLISTHFTATPGIPLPSPALKRHGFLPITGLSPELSGRTCVPACAPFTPNDSGQRLPPTYYRGCWHVVSRGFLVGYRHVFLPLQKKFTIREGCPCEYVELGLRVPLGLIVSLPRCVPGVPRSARGASKPTR